jgi:hypothetical protein
MRVEEDINFSKILTYYYFQDFEHVLCDVMCTSTSNLVSDYVFVICSGYPSRPIKLKESFSTLYYKEISGSSICEHNRQTSQRQDCSGSRICEHNRQSN